MTAWLQNAAAESECDSARLRVILTLHIQPGAKKSEVAGEHGDALKIRLAAPPVDGRANAALLDFLAARLALPKAALTLKSGQSSRRKRVEVVSAAGGLTPASVAARLLGN
ncbi:DUF167 domain-containing protein [Rhodocyclus gracilis]|uniref:UPF0235 protein GHK24_06640 n=1 Tax=Rhodocyclus tenuis TaxID=1066 RepID=A0A6L5JZ04_RHOTE|nr:DUF167 domain-containing protein [Rhodocyclus gracilis]MQY51448.1 hypothetical protein [Rhodocyclus gracilis]